MNLFSEVKARVSCIEICQDAGVALTKKGNNYIGICPFHSEKTASFVVHPDHYYCFGCGEGGDSISFISKLQGLKPLEAAKKIITRFNLPIEINQIDKPARRKKKRRYNQADFLRALEAWRDSTFPIYVAWLHAIEEIVREMTMDMPCFQALIEIKEDLDAITEWQISDKFSDVYKALTFTKSTIYELQGW